MESFARMATGVSHAWQTLEALFDPYINKPLTSVFKHQLIQAFSPSSTTACLVPRCYNGRRVPQRLGSHRLNKKPKEDPDAYALVPANIERQLAAMPSRQRNSTQSYHAQPVLIAPPQPLLLKGPSAKKEAIVKVPAGTRILPPRPNERVV